MLRAKPVLLAGDTAKLECADAGFTISVEGKATAQAADEQIVPTRMESGKFVDGIARPGGTAEVRF